MILYDLPKISSKNYIRKLFLIHYQKEKRILPRGPCDAAHARERATARGASYEGGTPRALMFLQNRPRTSSELQLSTNTISSSLITSHLTPWPFPNSPALTPDDSVHGGTASGGTKRQRRPPRTCAGPHNGSITISDLSGYAKRWCRVTRLAGEGYSGVRSSATAAPLFRWAGVAIGLID